SGWGASRPVAYLASGAPWRPSKSAATSGPSAIARAWPDCRGAAAANGRHSGPTSPPCGTAASGSGATRPRPRSPRDASRRPARAGLEMGRTPMARHGDETTCWSLIRRASAGEDDGRLLFAGRYEPFVRALLAARWRGSARVVDIDDAVQDVLVECFRSGGVLSRAGEDRVPAFRAFLVGVVRNVARRIEGRRGPLAFTDATPEDASTLAPGGFVSAIDPPSRDVERAWARALI